MVPTLTATVPHPYDVLPCHICAVQQARDEEYLRNLLLCELPALGERVQMIREGKAATNAAENDRQLERSQVRTQLIIGPEAWVICCLLSHDH